MIVFCEDFLEEMRNQWRIAAQRHNDIMTSNANVMEAIAKLTAAHAQLHTTITTAVEDMGAGGEAARGEMIKALEAAAAQTESTQATLLTAIAAQKAAVVTTVMPAAPVA